MDEEDHIGKAIGLAPIDGQCTEVTISTVEPEKAADDVADAKKNLRTLIKHGMDNVDEILKVAVSAQDDKLYNALSTYMKTIAGMNRDLARLTIDSGPARPAGAPPVQDAQPATPQNVTNQVFVGTTAELQRFMEDMKRDGRG